jgi:DNA-binding Lrp family transcriptional regulator
MYNLDEQERLIVRELIRNPRLSDNQIAIKTNVPLKTVNRKRKILEQKNILNYFCFLNNTDTGTGTFNARNMFIIVFKDGITRKGLLESFEKSEKALKFFPKHIFLSYVGEYGGNVALIIQLESRKADDLVEIYNAEILPELETAFGQGCVKETISIPIRVALRAVRNYLPGLNMKNGRIKDDWPNEHIFVDDQL